MNRAWDATLVQTSGDVIPDDEKAAFRSRLIPAILKAPTSTRNHFTTCLNRVLSADFPENWPEFMNIIVELLKSDDPWTLFIGLSCLLEMVKVYQWKSSEQRRHLNAVVETIFPGILQVGQKYVQEDTEISANIVYLIVKTYKAAITLQLPPALQQNDAIVPWGSFFLQIISKSYTQSFNELDNEEKTQYPLTKAKKWSIYNLNRLFMRYGNPNELTSQSENNEAFANSFFNNFTPTILQAYLSEVERWIRKEVWLSDRCLSLIIEFFENCVKPKATWAMLKPHYKDLLVHLIYPLLCPTESMMELWLDDPIEYVHQKLDIYENYLTPDLAANSLLLSLASKRRKATFMDILGFVNEVLSEYGATSEGERSYEKKDGALRMVGTLSSIILAKNSPVSGMMEGFLKDHVLPEFSSPHGFLRARACEMAKLFAPINFNDRNLLASIYQSVLKCLQDPDLPVRVEAALAMQPMVKHDTVRQGTSAHVPEIMRTLLNLSNEVDSDLLANVMETFVQVFSEELVPFALELTENLRDTFLRLTQGLLGGSTEFEEDDDYLDNDSKILAAMGILTTLGTLMLSLEGSPEVLIELQEALFPIIAVVLERELHDLYTETFEIIDSCTFSIKKIVPCMWRTFELTHQAFKASGIDYIEEMVPSLDNYLTYGAETIATRPDYLAAFADIINTVFESDRTSIPDKLCACKLAESMMLNLRGHIDDYVRGFVQTACAFLILPKEITKVSKIFYLEMIINALYYNPLLAIACLEEQNFTGSFFNLWFNSIDSFQRVHDKKLCILAITSLLSVPENMLPPSVSNGWSQLMQGVLKVFETLPAALKHREAVTKEAEEEDDDYDDDYYDDEWDENAWDDTVGDGDVKDESDEYLRFLSEEANKASSQYDDLLDEDFAEEFDEDPLFETRLDSIDAFIFFQDFLSRKSY